MSGTDRPSSGRRGGGAAVGYGGELIPGLFQTREYAAEPFRRKTPALGAAERERLIAVRWQRQGIPVRRLPAAPALRVVLSEVVLRRPIPDRVAMAAQLGHPRDVAALGGLRPGLGGPGGAGPGRGRNRNG